AVYLRLGNLPVARFARPAGIHEAGRPRASELHDRCIAQDVLRQRRQPLIHVRERFVKGRTAGGLAPRGRVYQDDVVVRLAIGLHQPGAHRERVVAQVRIALGLLVQIRTIVDDRNGGEPGAPARQQTGAVQLAHSVGVRDVSIGDEVRIDIEAADPLVEVEELRGGDGAGLEGRGATWDAPGRAG